MMSTLKAEPSKRAQRDDAGRRRDPHATLIGALHHALEGANVAEERARHADAEGDADLLGLFRLAEAHHLELAARARALLLVRLGAEGEAPSVGDEGDAGPELGVDDEGDLVAVP